MLLSHLNQVPLEATRKQILQADKLYFQYCTFCQALPQPTCVELCVSNTRAIGNDKEDSCTRSFHRATNWQFTLSRYGHLGKANRREFALPMFETENLPSLCSLKNKTPASRPYCCLRGLSRALKIMFCSGLLFHFHKVIRRFFHLCGKNIFHFKVQSYFIYSIISKIAISI